MSNWFLRTPGGLLAILVLMFLACAFPFAAIVGNKDQQPTESESAPGSGTIRYKDHSEVSIFVIGPAHQSGPADKDQAILWALQNELVIVTPGTKAWRTDEKHPWFCVSVEVADGPCVGFRGWIPLEAWNH